MDLLKIITDKVRGKETQQWLIAAVLTMLLLATRDNHFSSLHALPGASWAVFFIAGFYLRSRLALPGFLGLAGLIDLGAYLQGSGEAYCFTRSYFFLIPAYASMWLGGRWYRSVHRETLSTLPKLAVAMFLSSFLCELFSSGSFYFISGTIEQPSLTGYFRDNFLVYHGSYLSSVAFYLVGTAVIHACVGHLNKNASKSATLTD